MTQVSTAMVTSRSGGSGCRAAQNSRKALRAPADHLVAPVERSLRHEWLRSGLAREIRLARTGDAGDCFQGGGPAATQQAGVPGEPVLGQGRPAASQDRRDGLLCLRRSDMGWHPGPAAGHEGYRQVGGGDRADRSARLPAPAPGSPPGRTAATVALPGLLAPDVPSGQGLPPVRGSGPG